MARVEAWLSLKAGSRDFAGGRSVKSTNSPAVIRCTIFLGSIGKDGPIDTMLDVIGSISGGMLTEAAGLSPYNQVVFAWELVGIVDSVVGAVSGLDTSSGVLEVLGTLGGAP